MKIKRFIECYVPFSRCNFRCEYCYVIQGNRNNGDSDGFNYPLDTMAKALTKKRLGGTCYFNLCALGETLLCREVISIAEFLLKEGHYVNITTNGTISKAFDEILKMDNNLLERLGFSFSFHYLELLKHNQIDVFFDNIKKVKNHNCTILVQFNMYDNYIPYLAKMKELCIQHVGAPPQIAATRLEDKMTTLHTALSTEEYERLGDSFSSPLFSFTMKNFLKRNKAFCYAGDWSIVLDLGTGMASRCYGKPFQNIFENVDEPIDFKAVGYGCCSRYCVNSSHFKSLGVTPSEDTPTYAELRNRPEAGWYNQTMQAFLNSKLKESNVEYSRGCKAKYFLRSIPLWIKRVLSFVKHEIILRSWRAVCSK